MKILSETTEKGVTERRFDLDANGRVVPAMLWSPERAAGTRPVILLGHGGTQHKRAENILALARRLVRHLRYAAVSIDGPFHGDRQPREQQSMDAVNQSAPHPWSEDSRKGLREAVRRFRAATSDMVADWKATLDAVQHLDFVGAGGPVGYWGLSMGTVFGVPVVAAEPRINAAVLGLMGLDDGLGQEDTARAIKVPLLFVFQWNDELISREAGLRLYEAFASTEKTMHVNPGRHAAVPPFEFAAFEDFFVRHLGRAE